VTTSRTIVRPGQDPAGNDNHIDLDLVLAMIDDKIRRQEEELRDSYALRDAVTRMGDLAADGRPEQVTVKQAAVILGVSPRTVNRMIKDERLESNTYTGRRLISRASIDKALMSSGKPADKVKRA
jgi:excisionase family DNA binding protein